MKAEKFNYAASEHRLYVCPCCTAIWTDQKLHYCPNCEVKIEYASQSPERPTVTEEVTWEGHWYKYEYRTAKDRVDYCLATEDPNKYCNGWYLYSTKDPGTGKEFVIIDTNNPELESDLPANQQTQAVGVSEEYIEDKIGVIVDMTRFHDVRIDHILEQKEKLTKDLVKAVKELLNQKK